MSQEGRLGCRAGGAVVPLDCRHSGSRKTGVCLLTSYHHHPPFRLPLPWAHHPWGSGGVWCRGVPTAGRYLRVSWSNKLDGVRRHWVGMAEEGLPLNLWVSAILEPFVGMGDTSQTPPAW